MLMTSKLADACTGVLHGKDIVLRGVVSDSRRDCSDHLFVALRGENFDGHDFLEQAQARGATACLVNREVQTPMSSIVVPDTLLALNQIAAWWRAQFAIPVIGITGSVGKTTVKEMVAAILAQVGRGLVTEGNLNNEIGVPLTLLRLTPEDQYAIIEMGMNHAGEISRLAKVVQPTVALINNAAAAHLEGLGSVAAVAEAKGEIFEGLAEDGVAIINADDRHVQLWEGLIGSRRSLKFGLHQDVEIKASFVSKSGFTQMNVDCRGHQFEVCLNVPGQHNASNALAAIAAATALQVPVEKIIKGLNQYRPISGRLIIEKLGQLTLIDDSYNANPASMAAAIEVLAEYDSTSLIVGDMAELGDVAIDEHRRLGELASKRGIDVLLAYGEFAEVVVEGFGSERALSFKTQESLMDYLVNEPIHAGTVLVKGSRSARMERVVERIRLIKESQSELPLSEGGL